MPVSPRDVRDAFNAKVSLAAKIASGGEGVVYNLEGEPRFVAKLYHGVPSDDRRRKVEAMVTIVNERLQKLTAWPSRCLYDPRGAFIGFVMPRVSGHHDIHMLYSPKSRKLTFPQVDWRFLLNTAANTARAIAVVHETGCVIGDVNHGSLLVASDGTVKLIDCDSIQVTLGGRTYLCEVGVSMFTAPELQGQSLGNITRTTNHDNFALAVLIFQLLFLGRHPFSGRYHGQGEESIERAISEYRFAYGRNRSNLQMEPPPDTLLLEDLPSSLSQLFEAAFSKPAAMRGQRPSALEWVRTLDSLTGTLARCRSSDSHWFVKDSRRCPWCAIEQGTRGVLFPIPQRVVVSGTLRSLSELWNAVESVADPGPAPVIGRPAVQDIALPTSASGGSILLALLVGAGGVGAAIAVHMCWPAIAGPFGAMVIWAHAEAAQGNRRRSVAAASAKWSAARARWDLAAGDGQFLARRAALREAYEQGLKLDERKRQMIEHRRRENYLESQFIRRARLPGLGPGRCATLASFGVETAADIESTVISQVPGIGPVFQSRLIVWRLAVEREYRPGVSGRIDSADQAAVDAEITRLRQEYTGALVRGPSELSALRRSALVAREQTRAQIEREWELYRETVAAFGVSA
jgi:DNA-binding helix-hairpin-helix protein with protein kinase domain